MSQTAAYPEITAPRWGKEEKEVFISRKHAPYVHSTARNASLIHRVHHVRLRWWTPGGRGEYMVRLQSPRMVAVTNCGQWIAIDSTRGKVCARPKPDAVLCGMCHGKGRNFPHGEKHEIPVALARVRLGCIAIAEVA